MPTKAELHFVVESELEFFGGTGMPKEHFEGTTDNQGFTAQRWTDVPVVRRGLYKRRGKKVGKYVWNTETNSLKLIVEK